MLILNKLKQNIKNAHPIAWIGLGASLGIVSYITYKQSKNKSPEAEKLTAIIFGKEYYNLGNKGSFL